MRLLAIVALFVTASAFAGEVVSKKVSFSVGGRDLGSETYFACDSVKDTVKRHLTTLGAENIRVRCSGGIENWGTGTQIWPNFVTASFDAPVSTGAAVESITLKGRFDQNCILNVAILKNIIPALSTVTVVSKRDNCWDNSTRWSYDVTVAH